jgi:hypothetical protein
MRESVRQPPSRLLEVLSGIIEKSRLAIGASGYSERQLQAAAVAWAEIVGDVNPEGLEFAYRRVMRDREIRSPLQPKELRDACRAVALADRRAAQVVTPLDERCGLCDGTGYQLVEVYCPKREWSYRAARGCNCSGAPEKQRTKTVRDPDWMKGLDGVWRVQVGRGLPCTCRDCRPDLIPKGISEW